MIRKGTGMQEKTTQKTLPPDETALFCEQVAMVLKAGIPLGDGMETLARSYADSRYGERFARICVSLEKRGTFSQALEEAGIPPTERAERVTLEQFCHLARLLAR